MSEIGHAFSMAKTILKPSVMLGSSNLLNFPLWWHCLLVKQLNAILGCFICIQQRYIIYLARAVFIKSIL